MEFRAPLTTCYLLQNPHCSLLDLSLLRVVGEKLYENTRGAE